MNQSLFSVEVQNQLKQLKKRLTQPKVAIPQNNKQPKVAKHLDEKQLFMNEMADVTPIKPTQNVYQPQKTKIDSNILARRAAAEGEEQNPQVQLSDTKALLNPVSIDCYLSYKIPTLQNKQFQKLKQGKIHWYQAVDLHGASIEQARTAVLTLIQQAQQNNENCVKIIHGKGDDGILKTCVNGWLRQMPDVLAFCSAPNHQGGNGAVLVLLKKRKIG